jgi:hypothetical protein
MSLPKNLVLLQVNNTANNSLSKDELTSVGSQSQLHSDRNNLRRSEQSSFMPGYAGSGQEHFNLPSNMQKRFSSND